MPGRMVLPIQTWDVSPVLQPRSHINIRNLTDSVQRDVVRSVIGEYISEYAQSCQIFYQLSPVYLHLSYSETPFRSKLWSVWAARPWTFTGR